MDELWRKGSELLWERPLLWVPVLLADVLAFLVSLGSNTLVRTFVLSHMQAQSVLGGPALQRQLTPSALRQANLVAAAITIPADFLRLVLYALALVTTLALVHAIVRREGNGFAAILPAWGRFLGPIFSLSLRALAIYGGVAFVTAWVSRALLAHGHKVVVAQGWPELGFGLLRVALLAYLLAPEALEALAHRAPTPQRRRDVQIFAFALGIISLLLSVFVAANVRSVHIDSLAARYVLELTGSWIAALPYAVFFVILAIAIVKTAAEADFEATPELSA